MNLTMRVLGRAAKKALDLAKESVDPDRLVQVGMSGLIETAKARHESDPAPAWQPGEPLKLLLAGYVGTRNTGADVRVEEMIRQFRHLFGDDHVEMSMCTLDPALTAGYFRTVKQLHMPQIFHKFLFDTVREQHGVVICEGSMFKSKFANALSTMMVGTVGLASAEEKLAVGYGGEAGKMDASLETLVRTHCQKSLIITRNAESRVILDRLGVPTSVGTDTAWTFEAAPASVAEKRLLRAGWDGKKPIVALCPINPFWWPVKPDVTKAAMHRLGAPYDDSHYKSVYYHKDGPDVDRAFDQYIRHLAGALKDFTREHDCFPILVGMEQLDRRACDRLNAVYGGSLPLFVSDHHNMYEMVSILRRCSMIVSSRYHAVVCSMTGLVPSIGVTMDERIRNLMADRGQPELALEVDEDDLDEKLLARMRSVFANQDEVSERIGRCVVSNVERMGQMGITLVDHVRSYHPDFPFADGLGSGGSPWQHLPESGPTLRRVLERFGA